MLNDLLKHRGWQVTSCSRGGDRTTGILNRFSKLLTREADYKELLIYRSALNDLEVKTLYKGTLLQASLEIYAPLEEQIYSKNKPVKNLAQSFSEVLFRKVNVKKP